MAREDGRTLDGTGKDKPEVKPTGVGGAGNNTGEKRGTGSGAGTGTGSAAGTEKTEKRVPETSGVSDLKPDGKSELKKTKQKRKKVKKNDVVFNAEQITALLLTVSAIFSQSETGKIFALSEIECRQLAEPLANIIANNDVFKNLGEHADSVTLITTLLIIYIPKFMMFIDYKQKQKKLKKEGIKIAKGTGNHNTGANNTGSHRSSEPSNSTSERSPSLDGQGVLASIPSIM